MTLSSYAANNLGVFCGTFYGAAVGLVINHASPVRSRLMESIVSSALQQTGLCLCKNYSRKEVAYTALRGALVGTVREICSVGVRGLLASLSIKRSPFRDCGIQAIVSAVDHMAQKIIKWEMPSFYGTINAAVSGALASATTSCLGYLLPTPTTMRSFVAGEAAKGGVCAIITTYVRNLFFQGTGKRKHNNDLLLAAVAGSVNGAIGAILHGKLPEELKDKERSLEEAKKELSDLKAVYEKKAEQVRICDQEWQIQKQARQELYRQAEEAKKDAIKAHNHFVATGRGEDEWKRLQQKAAKAEDIYQAENRRDLPSSYDSHKECYAAYIRFGQQEEKIASLTDECLNQDSSLVASRALIAAIPNCLESVEVNLQLRPELANVTIRNFVIEQLIQTFSREDAQQFENEEFTSFVECLKAASEEVTHEVAEKIFNVLRILYLKYDELESLSVFVGFCFSSEKVDPLMQDSYHAEKIIITFIGQMVEWVINAEDIEIRRAAKSLLDQLVNSVNFQRFKEIMNSERLRQRQWAFKKAYQSLEEFECGIDNLYTLNIPYISNYTSRLFD